MAALDLHLEHRVARLTCGDEQGSAFFLSPSMAVTSAHCCIANIINNAPITLTIGDRKIEATQCSVEIPPSEDVMFLDISEPVDSTLVLPIAAVNLPRGVEWSSYGFPQLSAQQGAFVNGRVRRRLTNSLTTWDVELECDGTLPDHEGMSGAPLIVGGRVRGIIQRQLPNGLGAISFLRLRTFLDAADVLYSSAENTVGIPLRVAKELEHAISNAITQSELEDAILSNGSGYIVLFGSPGCGKTLLCASFLPSSTDAYIYARYFLGVHEADLELPPFYYAEPSVFSQWMGEAIGRISERAVVTGRDDGH